MKKKDVWYLPMVMTISGTESNLGRPYPERFMAQKILRQVRQHSKEKNPLIHNDVDFFIKEISSDEATVITEKCDDELDKRGSKINGISI